MDDPDPVPAGMARTRGTAARARREEKNLIFYLLVIE
jgi:hypothetical protein